MGTFEGHLLPGSAFLLLGTWHMVNVIAGFVAAPTSFHTRIWYPAPLPGRWRFLELYIIAAAASASIAMEMVVGQKGHWMLDAEGHIPIHMLAQFEHASMSLFFLLYALLALATEGGTGAWRPLPFGFLHVVVACALGQEYLLFLFHSGDHMGVEGQYHTVLRIPIALSLLAALLEPAFPRAFLLPLVRAAGVMLQGLLLMQTAFSIWVPSMAALHCTPTPDKGLWCEGEQWVHRAKALASLQFAWWCAVLLVFTALLFVCLRHALGKEDYLPLGPGEDLQDLEGGGSRLASPLAPHPRQLLPQSQAPDRGGSSDAEPGQGVAGRQ